MTRYSQVESDYTARKKQSIDDMRLAVAMLSMRRYMGKAESLVSTFATKGIYSAKPNQKARAAVAEAIVQCLTQAEEQNVWHEVNHTSKYQLLFRSMADSYMDAFEDNPEVLVHFIKSHELLDLIGHIETTMNPLRRTKTRTHISPRDVRTRSLLALYALETDADNGDMFQELPLDMKVQFMNVPEPEEMNA